MYHSQGSFGLKWNRKLCFVFIKSVYACLFYKEEEKQVSGVGGAAPVAYHPDVTATVRLGRTDVREEFPGWNLLMREEKKLFAE